VSNWEKTMKEWDDSVPDGIKYLSAEKQVLMRRVRELESENARLKDAQRWIPVSERLPEGDAVLVYRERGKSNIDIDWTFIEGGREYWYNSGLDNVTHWMPLPQLPEVTNDIHCRLSRRHKRNVSSAAARYVVVVGSR